jgi:hypothetical protein
MLRGLFVVKQPTVLDGLAFDPFSFQQFVEIAGGPKGNDLNKQISQNPDSDPRRGNFSPRGPHWVRRILPPN